MCAIGSLPAEGFSNRNRESVEFVVEPCLIRSRVGGKRVAGKLNKCLVPFAILFRSGDKKVMPGDDAAEIFVCYRYWVTERVEQNGICRLGTDAWQCDESISQWRS